MHTAIHTAPTRFACEGAVYSQHGDHAAALASLEHAKRIGIALRLVEAEPVSTTGMPVSVTAVTGERITAWRSDTKPRLVRDAFTPPAERPWVRCKTSAGISFGSGSASLSAKVYRCETPAGPKGLSLREAAKRGLLELEELPSTNSGFVATGFARLRGRVPGVVVRLSESYHPGGDSVRLIDLDTGLVTDEDGRPYHGEECEVAS